jgi:hypothetical protein
VIDDTVDCLAVCDESDDAHLTPMSIGEKTEVTDSHLSLVGNVGGSSPGPVSLRKRASPAKATDESCICPPARPLLDSFKSDAGGKKRPRQGKYCQASTKFFGRYLGSDYLF